MIARRKVPNLGMGGHWRHSFHSRITCNWNDLNLLYVSLVSTYTCIASRFSTPRRGKTAHEFNFYICSVKWITLIYLNGIVHTNAYSRHRWIIPYTLASHFFNGPHRSSAPLTVQKPIVYVYAESYSYSNTASQAGTTMSLSFNSVVICSRCSAWWPHAICMPNRRMHCTRVPYIAVVCGVYI